MATIVKNDTFIVILNEDEAIAFRRLIGKTNSYIRSEYLNFKEEKLVSNIYDKITKALGGIRTASFKRVEQ